jgi:hypothetical protein
MLLRYCMARVPTMEPAGTPPTPPHLTNEGSEVRMIPTASCSPNWK